MNTMRHCRLNREICRRENYNAKWASKDCYPERDRDCTDERARIKFILEAKDDFKNKSQKKRRKNK